MTLRIKEIQASQVGVALLVARMDGARNDFDVDLRPRGIGIYPASGRPERCRIRRGHCKSSIGRSRCKWRDDGRHNLLLARSVARCNQRDVDRGFLGLVTRPLALHERNRSPLQQTPATVAPPPRKLLPP